MDVEMDRAGYDGKVFNKLKRPTDVFAWRIKFPDDIPLTLMPEENFYITDNENYLQDYDIKIERRTNSVLVSPVDSYRTNVFYFLHIKSFEEKKKLGAKRLPSIHVGFKINDTGELELIWLKGAFDPKTVMERAAPVIERKATSVKQQYLGRKEFIHSTLLLKIAVVAALVRAALGFLNNPAYQKFLLYASIVASICALLQLLVFFLEERGKKKESVENYNLGAANFNAGYYQNAENNFNKALVLNTRNQDAERALDINRRYLTKSVRPLRRGSMELEKMKFKYNNTLLGLSGFMLFFYCMIADILPVQDISIYFLVFFLTILVLHLIFSFIQNKSSEKKSIDEYNKGASLFSDGSVEDALVKFAAAIKLNTHNLYAQNGKELVNIILLYEDRERREKEEAKKTAKANELPDLTTAGRKQPEPFVADEEEDVSQANPTKGKGKKKK